MSEVSSEEEKYDKSSFETLRFSTKIFPIEWNLPLKADSCHALGIIGNIFSP